MGFHNDTAPRYDEAAHRLKTRQAPGRSLLPLSPKRTQVRLKSLLSGYKSHSISWL
jgi:hypothetical protein